MRGAVLAGGGARRFGGRPKGLARVGGTRILDRVVDAVAAATGEPPILVTAAPEASRWRPELRVVPDMVVGAGALGGILTAVAAGPGPVLAVAWDLPFVTPDLLRALILDSADHDATLPESHGPRGVEPLCAVYAPACAEPIRQAIARGDLRTIGFHEAVRVGILPLAGVARHGDPDVLFFNVNRPEDLERAAGLLRDPS